MLASERSRFPRSKKSEGLRFGVLCLLVHNLQDHLTGGRTALGGRVNTDSLLRSTCILLPVHVYPEDQKDKDGYLSLGKHGLLQALHTAPQPKAQDLLFLEQGQSRAELGRAEKGPETHDRLIAQDPDLTRSQWLE